MAAARFIQLILPLRLEWEPFYKVPGDVSITIGDRVRVLFAGNFYTGVVSAVDGSPEISAEKIAFIEGKEETLPAISALEIEFWRQMAYYYLCTVGEVYKAAYPRMASQGSRLKLPQWTEPQDDITLSEEQADAFAKILPEKRPVLIHGVTGSGKTEVYLKLALQVLSEGKNVLFLVPEIALSLQLQERVMRHVGGALAYHSGLTPARRKQVASAVRNSPQYFILGTRSALFLPHRNLGLIIVDEEHDSSYKQDSPAPRYHARESAIMLAGIHGAKVVLGSATPSMESLYNAQIGRFARIVLPRPYHPGEKAFVEIIDISAERKKGGMAGNFSLKLLAHMKDVLEEGGKVLLLCSRRAYSPAVQCLECGFVPQCPRCNVSLALHRNPSRLVCHYCGHSEPFTGWCPQCGGELLPLGAGTQKIVDELIEYFPSARIARLDSDNAADEPEAIDEFAKGDIDILVGTQIVTKGFDFEGLRLVAVIEADNILAQQDFRADEKALQLMEQLRGRGGRRGEEALFVIQTRVPHHPVFALLESGAGSDVMLEERRLFCYPPFTRIIKITLRDRNAPRGAYMAAGLAGALSSHPLLQGMVVGPYSPQVSRIAGEDILEIRIMLPRDRRLQERKSAVSSAVNGFVSGKKYTGHVVIDVDPV